MFIATMTQCGKWARVIAAWVSRWNCSKATGWISNIWRLTFSVMQQRLVSKPVHHVTILVEFPPLSVLPPPQSSIVPTVISKHHQLHIQFYITYLKLITFLVLVYSSSCYARSCEFEYRPSIGVGSRCYICRRLLSCGWDGRGTFMGGWRAFRRGSKVFILIYWANKI